VAPQAAATVLYVAGLAQSVYFLSDRWQEKSLHCVQGCCAMYDILQV
jgi:hypothetical protein